MREKPATLKLRRGRKVKGEGGHQRGAVSQQSHDTSSVLIVGDGGAPVRGQLPSAATGDSRRAKGISESIIYTLLPRLMEIALPSYDQPGVELPLERCQAVAAGAACAAVLLGAPVGFLDFLLSVPWHELSQLRGSADVAAQHSGGVLLPMGSAGGRTGPSTAVRAGARAVANTPLDPVLETPIIEFLFAPERRAMIPPSMQLTEWAGAYETDWPSDKIENATVHAMLDGATLLHCAAIRGSAALVRRVLQYGGNVSARNTANELPIHCVPNCEGTPSHAASGDALAGDERLCRCLMPHMRQSTPCTSSAARSALMQYGATCISLGIVTWLYMLGVSIVAALGWYQMRTEGLVTPGVSSLVRRRRKLKRAEHRQASVNLLASMRAEATKGLAHLGLLSDDAAKRLCCGDLARGGCSRCACDGEPHAPGEPVCGCGSGRVCLCGITPPKDGEVVVNAEKAFACFVRAVHAMQGLDLRGGTTPRGLEGCQPWPGDVGAGIEPALLMPFGGAHAGGARACGAGAGGAAPGGGDCCVVPIAEQAEVYRLWAEAAFLKYRGCACDSCREIATQSIQMALSQVSRAFNGAEGAVSSALGLRGTTSVQMRVDGGGEAQGSKPTSGTHTRNHSRSLSRGAYSFDGHASDALGSSPPGLEILGGHDPSGSAAAKRYLTQMVVSAPFGDADGPRSATHSRAGSNASQAAAGAARAAVRRAVTVWEGEDASSLRPCCRPASSSALGGRKLVAEGATDAASAKLIVGLPQELTPTAGRCCGAGDAEMSAWCGIGLNLCRIVHVNLLLLGDGVPATVQDLREAQGALSAWARLRAQGIVEVSGLGGADVAAGLERAARVHAADIQIIETLTQEPIPPRKPVWDVLQQQLAFDGDGAPHLARPPTEAWLARIAAALDGPAGRAASSRVVTLARKVAESAAEQKRVSERLQELLATRGVAAASAADAGSDASDAEASSTRRGGSAAAVAEAEGALRSCIQDAERFPGLDELVARARLQHAAWERRREAVETLEAAVSSASTCAELPLLPDAHAGRGPASPSSATSCGPSACIAALEAALEQAKAAGLEGVPLEEARRVLRHLQARATAGELFASLETLAAAPRALPRGPSALREALTRAETALKSSLQDHIGAEETVFLRERLHAASTRLAAERAIEALRRLAAMSRGTGDLAKLESALAAVRAARGAAELDPDTVSAAEALVARLAEARDVKDALDAAVRELLRKDVREDTSAAEEAVEAAIEETQARCRELLGTEAARAAGDLARWRRSQAAQRRLDEALARSDSCKELEEAISEASAAGVKVSSARRHLKLLSSIDAGRDALARQVTALRVTTLRDAIDAGATGGLPAAVLADARAELADRIAAHARNVLRAAASASDDDDRTPTIAALESVEAILADESDLSADDGASDVCSELLADVRAAIEDARSVEERREQVKQERTRRLKEEQMRDERRRLAQISSTHAAVEASPPHGARTGGSLALSEVNSPADSARAPGSSARRPPPAPGRLSVDAVGLAPAVVDPSSSASTLRGWRNVVATGSKQEGSPARAGAAVRAGGASATEEATDSALQSPTAARSARMVKLSPAKAGSAAEAASPVRRSSGTLLDGTPSPSGGRLGRARKDHRTVVAIDIARMRSDGTPPPPVPGTQGSAGSAAQARSAAGSMSTPSSAGRTDGAGATPAHGAPSAARGLAGAFASAAGASRLNAAHPRPSLDAQRSEGTPGSPAGSSSFRSGFAPAGTPFGAAAAATAPPPPPRRRRQARRRFQPSPRRARRRPRSRRGRRRGSLASRRAITGATAHGRN
ncbi:unnamed protein product [Pedinophyceae sp. YPF-701]|nr:unnamed protein product [Pedinophyceae sp. YPF-701]